MSQNARLDPQITEVRTRSQGVPGATGSASPVVSTGLLGRLSVGQKLALAGLLVGVPFALSLGSLVTQQNRQVAHLQKQLSGHQLLAPLQSSMQQTQLIRLASTQFLQGDQQAATTLQQRRADLTKALGTLTQLAQQGGFTSVVDATKKAQQAFDALNFSVDSGSMTAQEAQAAYTSVLKNTIRPLFDEIANASEMRINTNAQVAQALSGITSIIPDNLPTAGAIVSGTTPTLLRIGAAGNVISSGDRLQVRQQWELSKEALDAIISQLNQFSSLSPAFKAGLNKPIADLTSASGAIFDGLQDGVLTPAKLNFTAAQLKSLTPNYASALFGSYETATKLVGDELKAEVAQARQQAILLALAALLGLALLGTLLYFISRAITQPLSRLNEASQRLSHGELEVNVPVTTRDEVGQLASSFNVAAARLRENAAHNEQERLEAQQLQQNVGHFLDVTMEIAEGDLTKRGQVTSDVLGNVVDSINVMVEELGETLKGVQEASRSVTGGSRAMLNSTAQIELGATTTTEETLKVARQAQAVNANIQEMARLAQVSAETARQALLASQKGRVAVNSTLEGMQNIRESSQSVSERVQLLAKRSEQIQEIVDSISHIASQTNLLSLHASIEAAGAGEAGSRFAVVAEEVRQLADESGAATTRIAALIATIQSEIREVSESMKLSAQQVEQGYQVAGLAGEQLRQIGTLSEESAQLAQTISQAATEQVRGVENMGQGVQQIAQIAQASQQSVKQGRTAAEELQNLAQQLNQSLTRFRLPG